MAPIFDANAGESGLRSLWSVGQDLVAAAATRTELQKALHEMQESVAKLQLALEDAQHGYAQAHAHAMAAGWTPHELRDLGLPRPTSDQRDSSTLRHSAAPPREAAPSDAEPRRRTTAKVERHQTPPVDEPEHETGDPRRRTSWEADQTSFLVASKSSDMPVWYESMRHSRISPSPTPFSAADLESSYWRGVPNPDDPARDPDAPSAR